MGYTLDLKRIPIGRYLSLLKTQTLLPGRRLLLDDIEHRFQRIEAAGIVTVYDLKSRLSTPTRLLAFSEAAGIPENYLIVLKRELGSLEQRPIPLSAFPGVDSDTIAMLHDRHIKTSKDFDEACQSGALRTGAALNETSTAPLDALFCLCQLVRINGIGPAAARALYESGYHSIGDIAGANAGELLRRITEVNAAGQYYQAKLGHKDMQFIIDAALLLQNAENKG
jgi:hypothetical protein